MKPPRSKMIFCSKTINVTSPKETWEIWVLLLCSIWPTKGGDWCFLHAQFYRDRFIRYIVIIQSKGNWVRGSSKKGRQHHSHMKLSTTADCSVISWSYKMIFDHYILLTHNIWRARAIQTSIPVCFQSLWRTERVCLNYITKPLIIIQIKEVI